MLNPGPPILKLGLVHRGRIKHKMDHLACFIPAMLALGAQQGAVVGTKAQQYMALAEDLGYTCWKMYSLQPTGAGSCPLLLSTVITGDCHCMFMQIGRQVALTGECKVL